MHLDVFSDNPSKPCLVLFRTLTQLHLKKWHLSRWYLKWVWGMPCAEWEHEVCASILTRHVIWLCVSSDGVRTQLQQDALWTRGGWAELWWTPSQYNPLIASSFCYLSLPLAMLWNLRPVAPNISTCRLHIYEVEASHWLTGTSTEPVRRDIYTETTVNICKTRKKTIHKIFEQGIL